MLADISNVEAIYIVCGRTDMRKSIDGLCAIIQDQQWYQDAKFGIFIHWSLFSVPAWAPGEGKNLAELSEEEDGFADTIKCPTQNGQRAGRISGDT